MKRVTRRSYDVGELRPSQFLFSGGIGAVVDLPSLSTVVLGLDAWDRDRCDPVQEPRLLKALQQAHGQQLTALCSLPAEEERDELLDGAPRPGIPVEPFPRWLVCPFCRMLLPVESGLLELKVNPYRPERTHYIHRNCQAKVKRPMLPVRFMRVCAEGHLDDLPWNAFVHRGDDSCQGRIRMDQRGVTGDASRITLRCLQCDARRSMADAFGDRTDPLIARCSGHHPHLGDRENDECDRVARTVALGASNAWFATTHSVISLPDDNDEVERLVQRQWDDLELIESEDELRGVLKTRSFQPFAIHPIEAVWAAVEHHRAEREQLMSTPAALRPPEWAVLTAPAVPSGGDFSARAVRPNERERNWLERLVLVDRLRLVQAFVGFTRLEAPEDPDSLGDMGLAPAPISRGPLTWVPAVESRGEGIFLQIREQAIAEWRQRDEVGAIEKAFRRAHAAELKKWQLTPEQRPFPGMRYLLLHSLSHALMRQIALESGYAAASLSERIYSAEPEDEDGPMAGILIMTSAADSEGTLGGLVRLGDPDVFGWHVRQALAAAGDCASDPFCAEHTPTEDAGSLFGAACHGCLFSPETSCERGNRYLDRNVLVETFSGGGGAFFPGID